MLMEKKISFNYQYGYVYEIRAAKTVYVIRRAIIARGTWVVTAVIQIH